jgi:hypothetical protein
MLVLICWFTVEFCKQSTPKQRQQASPKLTKSDKINLYLQLVPQWENQGVSYEAIQLDMRANGMTKQDIELIFSVVDNGGR